MIREGDDLGHILVQVQNDLTQLKKRLSQIDEDGILDVHALDSAICRTEKTIKSRAVEYFKTENKHVLTLPFIEHFNKKTVKVAKWQLPTHPIPYIPPQKYLTAGVSTAEKHKAAFTMRVLYNPNHPNHSELMDKNYDIQRPVFYKKPGTIEETQKTLSSTVAVVPKYQNRLCKEDKKSGKIQKDKHQLKNLTIASKPVGAKCPTVGATLTPPPSAASDNRLIHHRPARLVPLIPQCVPSSQHVFNILEGQIDSSSAEFRAFKEHYCLHWSTLQEALWQLELFLQQYAVPHALVCGNRLVALVQSGELYWGTQESLLSALKNREEVLQLIKRPGQRYKGKGGHRAAAVRIQACWRCYQVRTAYIHQQRRKGAARTIAISWLLHSQLRRVKKSLQATRLRQLENYHSRVKILATNWNQLITSKRTIIHVPSLGYSQEQRHSLKRFDILQNMQIGRLFDINDENVEVIYICPVPLTEDLGHYYTHLLGLNGHTGNSTWSSCAKRFTILTPEAHQYFSYSPHTLRRIKNLIQGKQAYLVSGVPHIDDLAVADELGVPVLGPEPVVAQLYGTKSGIRRIFSSSGVSIAPGQADIYTQQQLHECFAQLMTDHLEVQRWLFKINDGLGDVGTAYCDLSQMSCRPWALQEYHRSGPQIWRTAWGQERVLRKFLEDIPALLAAHSKPFDTSFYPTWSLFLEDFLKKGGVIEAFPPSDSVRVTVDVLVEPGGDIRMLSCGDQLHRPGLLQVSGCTVPQKSVCPKVLNFICMQIGKVCQERHILGHFSLDVVTFLEHGSLKQQVWAVDMDLGYSNQLAMTQIVLHITGGSLDCHTGHLKVPSPLPVRNDLPLYHVVREINILEQFFDTRNVIIQHLLREGGLESNNSPRHRILSLYITASIKSDQLKNAAPTDHFALMSSRLFHTNLSMVQYSVLFQMCKARGIGFDIREREGSVFVLYDNAERSSLGMITISPDLPGALLTFARNLTVIHQEISAPNMQGETNFKDLVKIINEAVNIITQKTNKKPKLKEIYSDV